MPQLDSSKNLLHSSQPLVVGAVSSAATLEALASDPTLAEGCDLLELRLDSIDLAPDESRPLAQKLRLPLLITARHPEEGGQYNLDATERATLLDAHLDLAALMDVELRSAMDLDKVISKAKARHVGVIGSFHDFNATPGDDVLRGAADFALQFKLDAVKVATTLQQPEDLARLIQLVAAEKRLPVAAMGMGNLGRASRLVLAKCGSLLNYGYVGESNAPGQWAASELKKLLNAL